MLNIGIIMDPISQINIKKDSSFAMCLGLQNRGHTIQYIEAQDIWQENHTAWAKMHTIKVEDNPHQWYQITNTIKAPLNQLDAVLMRLDPPVDDNYITITHILERAQQQGLLVLNNPRGLRNTNEKLFTTWFPECCPPQIISHQRDQILEFVQQYGRAVIKPINNKGGQGIFQLRIDDTNLPSLIEQATHQFTQYAVIQQYIPAIRQGDKRVLIINGEAIPKALLRTPKDDDFRGNLNAGASGQLVDLNDRDLWIVNRLAPTLKERGLSFVGIDIIGEYLTEINITSPTCAREIQSAFSFPVLGPLFDFIEEHCPKP